MGGGGGGRRGGGAKFKMKMQGENGVDTGKRKRRKSRKNGIKCLNSTSFYSHI